MVEKMKLLHITGPKNDIDRVMEQYLSRYEIHFENAASGFGISGHVLLLEPERHMHLHLLCVSLGSKEYYFWFIV